MSCFYLNNIESKNIYIQIDLIQAKILSYFIDTESSKIYILYETIISNCHGLFIIDKSNFQHSKVLALLDSTDTKFYLLSEKTLFCLTN